MLLLIGNGSAAELLYRVNDALTGQRRACFVNGDMYLMGMQGPPIGDTVVFFFGDKSNTPHTDGFAAERSLLLKLAHDHTPCVLVFGDRHHAPMVLAGDLRLNVVFSLVPKAPIGFASPSVFFPERAREYLRNSASSIASVIKGLGGCRASNAAD